MDEIRLIEVNPEYIEEIEAFRQEVLSFDKDNEDRFAGCMSLDTLSADEWVRVCDLRKDQLLSSRQGAYPECEAAIFAAESHRRM